MVVIKRENSLTKDKKKLPKNAMPLIGCVDIWHVFYRDVYTAQSCNKAFPVWPHYIDQKIVATIWFQKVWLQD